MFGYSASSECSCSCWLTQDAFDRTVDRRQLPALHLSSFKAGRLASVPCKVDPKASTREALRKIAAVCKTYSPSVPFSYKFADEEYAKKFGNEERIGKLTGLFSVLAILISCLGLFGMASFVAEQRTKEIGLRKVLGASVFNLWKMLSKDFVLLVMISCCIASPIAWYYLQGWLQQYEYRTEISWWVFVAAGACALIITLLTISFQAIKAAVANPVKSLRAE